MDAPDAGMDANMLAVLLRPFSTMSPSSLDCWDTTVVTASGELLQKNK
jgi:hypothetical protein